MRRGKPSVVSLVAASAVALAVVHIAPSIATAQPFTPSLRITDISDQTPSANADMTAATAFSGGVGVGSPEAQEKAPGTAGVVLVGSPTSMTLASR